MIILHGLFGMSDNWSTLSQQFAMQDLMVYVVDARNHGRSAHSDEFNYDLMAEDLIELMDDEKISTADVIGHSMGGKTGMWLACKHPERVSKLISSDIAPGHYKPHHQTVFSAIHSIDLRHLASRKEAESGLRKILHDEPTIQFLLKNIYWNEKEKLSWRFNLSAIENNIESIGKALPPEFRFNGQVLFLRGEKSDYITDSDQNDILNHFPRADEKTVPGAGHWIHADNPKGFIDAAMTFLK